MEVNTDPVFDRAGEAAPQLDVSHPQPMEVSREQCGTRGATKRTAETQVTPNSAEFSHRRTEELRWTSRSTNKRDVSN